MNEPGRILAIEHMQLAMPAGGEDAARAFYGRTLGLLEVAKPPSLAHRGGVWFSADAVNVHLGVEAEFRPARKAHPAFVVSDLNAMIDVLRRDGVEVDPAIPFDGWRRIYVHDPFGNRIELMEPA